MQCPHDLNVRLAGFGCIDFLELGCETIVLQGVNRSCLTDSLGKAILPSTTSQVERVRTQKASTSGSRDQIQIAVGLNQLRHVAVELPIARITTCRGQFCVAKNFTGPPIESGADLLLELFLIVTLLTEYQVHRPIQVVDLHHF